MPETIKSLLDVEADRDATKHVWLFHALEATWEGA